MNLPFTYAPLPPVPDERDRMIRAHMPLVRFHVERMTTQVPSFMTREEMTSAATLGLLDAANRFDPAKGVLFKTFAEQRIRGAILDEARRLDWFSRTLREKQARLSSTLAELEGRLGRSPSEEEMASALGVGLEDYRDLLTEVSHLGWVSIHQTLDQGEEGRSLLDVLADGNGRDPLQNLEARELAREMAAHLEGLGEKERLVLTLYYYEELTQKEIAEVLSVTEGRVSQLHSQALLKLRNKLSRRRR